MVGETGNKEKVCNRVEKKVELMGLNEYEWKKRPENAKGKEYMSKKMAHECNLC